jgi:hypothetical protein
LLSPGLALGEIRLLTYQLDSMVTWWSQFLDAAPLVRGTRTAIFASADGRLRLVLTSAAIAGAREEEMVGVESVSFVCRDGAHLAAAYDRLVLCDIEPEIADTDGLVASFRYRDPDRNSVAVQVVVDGTAVDLQRWLAGEPLAREPLATEIDPEALAGMLRRGVSADDVWRAAPRSNPHFVMLKD